MHGESSFLTPGAHPPGTSAPNPSIDGPDPRSPYRHPAALRRKQLDIRTQFATSRTLSAIAGTSASDLSAVSHLNTMTSALSTR
ncbi:MAG: hypothetical protein CM1200mP20_08390 [Pseudomonadota bacterium]|nr:MAG: hypothetical protein CM1200mP20_08390 [Pseudomonadota bacterium]